MMSLSNLLAQLQKVALQFCLYSFFFLASVSHAAEFILTNDPAVVISIQISDNAAPQTKQSAEDLSAYLSKIFGKPFPIQTGENANGIVLGTLEDFPQYKDQFKEEDLTSKETYLFRSRENGLDLIGTSPLAVQDGVWDLLYRIGYRHYFPSSKWEIVPKVERVALSVDAVNRPSFITRTIGMGGGIWPELREEYGIWIRHNRLESGFILATSHAYGRITNRNLEEFKLHPEYFTNPLENPSNKFVIANPGLQKLVIEDSLKLLREKPDLDSISMEPTDGGGWPKSSPLGSISNQALTLANVVAEAIQAEKPGVKVGMYAYNEHSPGPTIKVNPNVIISVATAFLKGGNTVDGLVKQWTAQGATIGIRDFLGVWPWDQDLPGKSKGSAPEKVAASLASYHRQGARYYIAEASHSYGPNGIGFFVASRCLWDIGEARKVDAIREEFLSNSFGPAREAMGRFYTIIDNRSAPLLSDHLLAGMYRALRDAYTATSDEVITTRIDDLAAYTRYVELYINNQNASAEMKQQAFQELTEFCDRIRPLGMVHTRNRLREQRKRLEAGVTALAPTDFYSTSPPTHEELKGWVNHGADHYQLLTFQPKSFDTNLVPLPAKLAGPASKEAKTFKVRGKTILFTYIGKKEEMIKMDMLGGQIYGNRGPIKISVLPLLHPLGESIADLEIPADKAKHEVELKSDYTGLHRIEIDDGHDATTVNWNSRLPLVFPSSPEILVEFSGTHDFYFYVPPGTKTIAGYTVGRDGDIVAPDDTIAHRFSDMEGPGYFQIAVPKGEDGRIWMLKGSKSKKILMTVPPYLSLSSDSLLIPEKAEN